MIPGEERTELARENHLIMRRLGMQPVLQGYSGMVPWDIQRYDPEVEVIEQGTWCSFRRPHMLKTMAAGFERYAELFNPGREIRLLNCWPAWRRCLTERTMP